MTAKGQLLFLVGCAVAILTIGHATAEPGKGKGPHHEGHRAAADAPVIIIDGDDRGRIREFLHTEYRTNCPPGLAKKNNGCLPPGQAKKYRVGDVVLAEDTRTIWQKLADMISPPPAGYRYVRTERDVLLVDRGNHVVDIISVD